MDNKQKLISQQRYLTELQNKLASPTPAKHKNREESYRLFLASELKKATSKVESLKLSVGAK